ncbi:MAG TPA: hypothetical protein VHF02_10740 [Luteimonas sp.]|nr:hypothetical protein [Luteimonas sp.]
METATDIRIPGLHRYPNLGGQSGVVAYAARRNAIAVEFTDGKVYLYSYEVPGRHHVERMKSLADEGIGLSTYISRHVGNRFAARLR